MELVYNLLVRFFDTIRRWVGLILPLFAEAADFRAWPKWLKVVMHLIILAMVLAGLYFLNQNTLLQKYLLSKGGETLKQIYLPLLFILLYALCWLGFWLYKLLGQEEAGAYPDIDAAWAQATAELRAAGLPLDRLPIYLVVGRPATGEDPLFVASALNLTVRAPAQMMQSPIRIYAGASGAFITCSGASAWGLHAGMLAGEITSSEASFASGGGNEAATKTLGADAAQIEGLSEDQMADMRRLLAEKVDRELTPEEQGKLREYFEISSQAATTKKKSLPPDLKNDGPSRLAYLCRLIRKDRYPWCPINGALALVPFSALESDEACKEAVDVLNKDLAAAREALRLRFVTYVGVCDIETAPGFPEFRRAFPSQSLKQRIGLRLPVLPDVPTEKIPSEMERAADWIRNHVVRSWVVRFLRLDWPPDERKTKTFIPASNRRLFGFLHEIHTRGPRLGRLLGRGLPIDGRSEHDPVESLPLVGGCYLMATGRQANDQAFVPGVFQRLVESENTIRWAPRALAEDARYRKLATVGYCILALVVAGLAGFVYYVSTRDSV
jgi:hypothetical protein